MRRRLFHEIDGAHTTPIRGSPERRSMRADVCVSSIGQRAPNQRSLVIVHRVGAAPVVADGAGSPNAGFGEIIRATPHRVDPPAFSASLYNKRNAVERYFNKLKQFRAVATRYGKRDDNFLASVKLASLRIWLRVNVSVAWLRGLGKSLHPLLPQGPSCDPCHYDSAAFRAWLISARISSGCSMPTESLT